MPDDSIQRLGGQATRRGILKGVAAAGLGAVAASGLPSGVLAAGPSTSTIEGPGEQALASRIGTPTSPLYQSFTGLGDFRRLVASNTWTFKDAYSLVPTNLADGFVARVALPQGSVIQSVTYYVQNSGPVRSNCYLLLINPVTSAFVMPLISKQPLANASGYQALNLDLPSGGVQVDNSKYAFHLGWYPTVGDGTQALAGARIAYFYDPGLQLLDGPVRVVDTRVSSGPIGGVSGPLTNGSITDFAIAGANGIPANATAVFGNLTAVEFSPGNGYMTLYPTGAAVPNASSINFGGGEPNQLANFFQVKLGTGGKVRLYVSGTSTNAIIDIAGYVI